MDKDIDRCPICGSAIEETPATVTETIAPAYHVAGRRLPTRERETTVAACTGCDFIIDLRQRNGAPKTSHQLLMDIGRML